MNDEEYEQSAFRPAPTIQRVNANVNASQLRNRVPGTGSIHPIHSRSMDIDALMHISPDYTFLMELMVLITSDIPPNVVKSSIFNAFAMFCSNHWSMKFFSFVMKMPLFMIIPTLLAYLGHTIHVGKTVTSRVGAAFMYVLTLYFSLKLVLLILYLPGAIIHAIYSHTV